MPVKASAFIDPTPGDEYACVTVTIGDTEADLTPQQARTLITEIQAALTSINRNDGHQHPY